MDTLISQVDSIFFRFLRRGDALILGVSGGPDSVALLHLLAHWNQETERALTIVAAHVNHGIRGGAALRDARFVRALAKNYGLHFEERCVELADRTHQEELGREARRRFFEELRAKYQTRFILTAHTADDQVETIVFNFFRGSGPAGLAGMKVQNGAYLKPFLAILKADILQYLRARRLKFCKDQTNDDTRYRRNFIRKKLLPLCEKITPGFRRAVLNNADIFRALHEELEVRAEAFLKVSGNAAPKTDPHFIFSQKDFVKLPRILQQTVLQKAFQTATDQSYRLSNRKIEEVMRVMHRNIGRKKIITGKTGGVFSLNKGLAEFRPF